jgi:hypothetical protein
MLNQFEVLTIPLTVPHPFIQLDSMTIVRGEARIGNDSQLPITFHYMVILLDESVPEAVQQIIGNPRVVKDFVYEIDKALVLAVRIGMDGPVRIVRRCIAVEAASSLPVLDDQLLRRILPDG